MKKNLIILMVLFSLVSLFSCDETEDVNAVSATSGSNNIELADTTFTSTGNGGYSLYKYASVYNANSIVTSQSSETIYLTDTVYTFEFVTGEEENTFTLTVAQNYNANFEARYSYTYHTSAARANTTYNQYSEGSLSNFNRSFTGTGVDGSAYGESDQSAISGYSGQAAQKTVYSGTWEQYTINTDGLEDMTTMYRLKVTSKAITTYTATAFSPTYAVADYTTTTYQVSEDFGELEIGCIGTNQTDTTDTQVRYMFDADEGELDNVDLERVFVLSE